MFFLRLRAVSQHAQLSEKRTLSNTLVDLLPYPELQVRLYLNRSKPPRLLQERLPHCCPDAFFIKKLSRQTSCIVIHHHKQWWDNSDNPEIFLMVFCRFLEEFLGLGQNSWKYAKNPAPSWPGWPVLCGRLVERYRMICRSTSRLLSWACTQFKFWAKACSPWPCT